jgi:hypothetical protein
MWKEPETATSRDPEPVRPPVSRLEEKAARALAEARDTVKAHPDDLMGALALYERLTWECRGTSLLPDAQKEYQALQSKVADRISRELSPILDETRAARRREDFPKMLAVLAEARGRHPWPDWTAALDRESREVGLEEGRLFAQLRLEAEEAKTRGDGGRAKAILDRISRWGSPELAETLKSALEAIKPPPPVRSPEEGRYRGRWEAALRWMACRSMAEALQELERARKEITDSALGKEADGDLALARAAQGLLAAAADNLQKSPKGRSLSLLLEAGEKVDGSFERALQSGVELKRDAETLAVDLAEVSARCLVSYVTPSDDSGRCAAALLLLLDGDSSQDPGLLPPKYGEFLPRLGHLFPAQAEDDARAAYAQAEQEFLDPSGRALSLERYQALSEQFAQTRFVLRRRAPIASRMAQAKEAGRDYLLLAWDLSGGGTFKLVSQKKGETAWTSPSEAPSPNANFVDFSFVALPGQDYKGWVLLGGCCLETFSHFVQGTEFSAPLPDRPGERGPAEPGTTLLVPGKPPQVFLKRLHSQHGGPKTPARWEWVPLPLPKYASGGRKTIRLLSAQQGFSVRAALITVAREIPPGEMEIKELERSRQRPPGGTAIARDAAMVGHWKLDDAKGTLAADASGNGLVGSLRNGPAWSTGRKGGALSFNGINQYVELGNAPKLTPAGPFTVAAWVNPAAVGGKHRYILADYVERGDQSSFALSIEPSGQAAFFWENPSGIEPKALSRSIPKAGTWVHLAGVWDGSARKVYVNGVLEGTETASQPRPSGVSMVAIGRPGAFNGLYFSGDIEDVRLYSRALSDAELSVLALGGKAR